MQLFDSHCHLDDRSYDRDLSTVLENARHADVKKMMVVGITRKSCAKAVDLATKHPNIYASVGIHPHDARQCDENTLDTLKSLAQNPKVRAWGETGLDFNRMFSPREVQEKWFLRQMQIAGELGLPLIFHERDSQGRFLDMLKANLSSESQGVVHCFSGSHAELNAYLSLGLYIGITGIVTIQKRGEPLRRMLPQIPKDRLLIETDAPYLTPAPEKNRTRRNEPAFVKSVMIKVAQVREEDPEELARAIWDNTHRLYGI